MQAGRQDDRVAESWVLLFQQPLARLVLLVPLARLAPRSVARRRARHCSLLAVVGSALVGGGVALAATSPLPKRGISIAPLAL